MSLSFKRRGVYPKRGDMKRAMAEFFHEGGILMYPIALLGLAALALGAVAAGAKQKGVAVGALVCATTVMLLSVAGMMMGRMQVKAALEVVNPADREQIMQVGYAEANRPLQLGVPMGVLGAMLGLVGFTLANKQS